MVTMKEVMQHVKEEKGAGSDRYKKLYDYFTKFSPMELAYLETECRRTIDAYRMPRSWNAITLMISMLSLLVMILVGNLSIRDQNLVIEFGIGALILVALFGIIELRRIRCFEKSNKLIEVQEIVQKVQKEKNNISN